MGMRVMDSKASPYFTPMPMQKAYNHNIHRLNPGDCSEEIIHQKEHLLAGNHVLWGIPFELGQTDKDSPNILLLRDSPVTLDFSEPVHYPYLVFLHAADFKATERGKDGLFHPMMGTPRLGETVCEYTLLYSDGTSHSVPIRRRFEISEFRHKWGENSFLCVPHQKPDSFRTNTEEVYRGRMPKRGWGHSQFRTAAAGDAAPMQHWLYAMENPHPGKELVSVRFQPQDGTAFIFGVTGCQLHSHPLRWEAKKKVKITLADLDIFDTNNNEEALGVDLEDIAAQGGIDIDLGQVISVSAALDYPREEWESGYNNQQPAVVNQSILVEYTAHPDAFIYLGSKGQIQFSVKDLQSGAGVRGNVSFWTISEASRPVTLKVVDKQTGKPVPVKIHIHGEAGEYLPPMNRHRIPNPYWFEDYSPDFVHKRHYSTYIDGEAEYRLPLGNVYIEVSKGFEIAPVRKTFRIEPDTDSIIISLEHVLPWRQKGWVTADTHVHFLSPNTALLEGEAEGVNVVNLLASQWGELFTNVGDFDGKTTFGSRENGGSGEYLLRVGTENRQHILGHISLLGYQGKMILPLTTGGPDESALGDPVEETLTNWARQCREQNGLAILPHFPNPRAEGAAALVLDQIDGVEMTSWGDLYSGIDPYSLSDWYRYLNCGYQVPAVGGTDKMASNTAVGTVRTYALIKNALFTYDTWKDAVRKGLTFVTYGPLVDFHVSGYDPGSRIELPEGGGTLDIDWKVSTVTIPVTKIELVVNGETREVREVDPRLHHHTGSWSLKMNDSGWAALRVRGCQPGKPEVITAHTSTVMIYVGGKSCFKAADAMTILDQIEGAAAYVRTLGTKAEEKTYKQLMMTLTSAHRALHNRMHQNGIFHNHSVLDDHHKD